MLQLFKHYAAKICSSRKPTKSAVWYCSNFSKRISCGFYSVERWRTFLFSSDDEVLGIVETPELRDFHGSRDPCSERHAEIKWPHEGWCWHVFALVNNPIATPRAPAHMHTKVTAHHIGFHPYEGVWQWGVHRCVHTDVHVRYNDRRWVLTSNVHCCMVWIVVKAVCDKLMHAVWIVNKLSVLYMRVKPQ